MIDAYRVVNNGAHSNGTCLQGYVDVAYSDLIDKFGQPGKGDGYKVDAEWVILFGDTVVTIYNYKTGPNYNEGGGLPVEQIRDWHIGGFDTRAVEAVRTVFPWATVSKW